VYKDSSAFEQGVLKGDQLRAINGDEVDGWELSQIEKQLKIPEDATVQLTLLHPQEAVPYDVLLICRIIWIPTVSSEYYDDTQIGYIRINKFRDQTAHEFLKALETLNDNTLKGLVVDVRGNSGGDETQAIALSSLFLPDRSLVIYFVKKDVGRREEKTKGDPLSIDYPLVILIDKKSASSSEIFAGTMQHYGKAFLVGTNTSGHGSLKNTISLSDGSVLFLITSRTYLPNDTTFDRVGLTPDLIVDRKEEQLERAFDFIQGRKFATQQVNAH